MNKDTTVYLVGFAIIAVMCTCTLALVNGDFGGSDDAGGGAAGDIAGEPVYDEDGNPVWVYEDEGEVVYEGKMPYMVYPAKVDDKGNPVQLREYKTWWNGIFGDYELPGETESLLFAVQAAIGAIIIGFFIGQNSGRKKALAEMGVEQTPEQTTDQPAQ